MQALLTVIAAAVLSLALRYTRHRNGQFEGKTLPIDTSRIGNLDGTSMPLLATDSLTFLVMADAHCDACRIEARSYVRWAKQRHSDGAAVRILMTGDLTGIRQYARLAGDTNAIARADTSLYKLLGIERVPTLVLVNPTGKVLGYWREWHSSELMGSIGASQ